VYGNEKLIFKSFVIFFNPLKFWIWSAQRITFDCLFFSSFDNKFNVGATTAKANKSQIVKYGLSLIKVDKRRSLFNFSEIFFGSYFKSFLSSFRYFSFFSFASLFSPKRKFNEVLFKISFAISISEPANGSFKSGEFNNGIVLIFNKSFDFLLILITFPSFLFYNKIYEHNNSKKILSGSNSPTKTSI
jgi:hypothetical protein